MDAKDTMQSEYDKTEADSERKIKQKIQGLRKKLNEIEEEIDTKFSTPGGHDHVVVKSNN